MNFRKDNLGNKKNENEIASKVISSDAATILHHVIRSKYGDHNFLMYSCLSQLEDFYAQSCKHAILNRNDIYVLATYYQDSSFVRRLYREDMDIAKCESDGTFVILDSEVAYRYAKKSTIKYYDNDNKMSNTYNLVIMIDELARHVEILRKSGITIFSDLSFFILNKEIMDLVSYEVSVPNIFDSRIRAICCYHKDDFERLKEEQRQRILAAHANNFIVA